MQLDWLVDKYLREIFEAYERLITSAQKTGHFIEGSPRHLVYVMIGAVTRVFLLGAEVETILGKAPSDESFIEEHMRICLGLFFRKPGA